MAKDVKKSQSESMMEILIAQLKFERPIAYEAERLLLHEKLKASFRQRGFHHPSTCSNKDGTCENCSGLMVGAIWAMPPEWQALLDIMITARMFA